MRIAIYDAFPNRQVAETEFQMRFLLACKRLGWEAVLVQTSDDIITFAPDCVLATHEFCVKLTDHPTIGLSWSPPTFFADSPEMRQGVLAYDAMMSGGPAVTRTLRDFAFGTGRDLPIHEGFYPSTHKTDYIERAPDKPRRLFYAGVNWDRGRHEDLFRKLEGSLPLDIYGPVGAWIGIGFSYRGEAPMDGTSLIECIRSSGAALAIHKDDHRQFNLPSMRIFEAAAAGAVIITDDMPFTRGLFGDSALYVSQDADIAQQIASHMDWITQNPDAASANARICHEIFHEKLCIEAISRPLPQLLDRIEQNQAPSSDASIAIILRIRSGDQPVSQSTIQSLVQQNWSNICLIIAHDEELSEADFSDIPTQAFSSIRYRKVRPGRGQGELPSTAFWCALCDLGDAEFVILISAGDEMMRHHVTSLAETLRKYPTAATAFSGYVSVAEPGSNYVDRPNFPGPKGKTIHERRSLHLPPQFELDAQFGLKGLPQHAFMFRTSKLDEDALYDPELPAFEAVYLAQLLTMQGARAISSGRATAIFAQKRRPGASISNECEKRIRRRLEHFSDTEAPGFTLRERKILAIASAKLFRFQSAYAAIKAKIGIGQSPPSVRGSNGLRAKILIYKSRLFRKIR